MLRRIIFSALLLSAFLLCGCLVEPAGNTPAANASAANANANAAEGRPVAEAQTSPGSSPSPEVGPSPESSPVAPMPVGSGGKIEAYMVASAAHLAPEQREALLRIPEESRRLLALRGYLRAGRGASERWAWSRAQIENYEKSPEYAAALAEIEKVNREFAASNAGYTLRVNTQVRSLDEQLSKWNENDSVRRAGEELFARAQTEVANTSYAEPPGAGEVERFERFLRGADTRTTPTLAVPGLSPHGQARAFDFQVMRGGALVAGPSSPSAWDAAGWTAKLQESVGRASTKFSGPLESPREPWHYDYRP